MKKILALLTIIAILLELTKGKEEQPVKHSPSIRITGITGITASECVSRLSEFGQAYKKQAPTAEDLKRNIQKISKELNHEKRIKYK